MINHQIQVLKFFQMMIKNQSQIESFLYKFILNLLFNIIKVVT